jgi:hypothetical protein
VLVAGIAGQPGEAGQPAGDERTAMTMDQQFPAQDVPESEVHGPVPMPVSPSEGTERLDGVAFDLPAGTETPGMPSGDQRAANEDDAQTVQESVEVPPGHLNLPGTDGTP